MDATAFDHLVAALDCEQLLNIWPLLFVESILFSAVFISLYETILFTALTLFAAFCLYKVEGVITPVA